MKKLWRRSRRETNWSRNIALWRLVESMRTLRWTDILNRAVTTFHQQHWRTTKKESCNDNVTFAPKRERKKEEKEEKQTRCSCVLRPRVNPMIVPVWRQNCCRNDWWFARNKDSKSVANVGKSRGVASRLGLVGPKKYIETVLRRSWGKENGIDDI